MGGGHQVVQTETKRNTLTEGHAVYFSVMPVPHGHRSSLMQDLSLAGNGVLDLAVLRSCS